MKRIFVNILCLALIGFSMGGVLLLMNGGSKMLSVQSDSMVPLFRRGALVLIQKSPERDYKVGDIVTYTDPRDKNSTITHRIVHVDKLRNGQPSGEIITKGDANRTADSPISSSMIVGKVHYALPYMGFVYNFMIHPIGLLSVIYAPTLWIIISEVINLARYYKSREPYISPFFTRR